MPICVVDASVFLALVMPDEIAPNQRVAMAVVAGEAMAPPHWVFEVCNGLVVGLRRGRMTETTFRAACDELRAIEVGVDDASMACCWSRTIDLAAKLGLSVYDCAYLELAQRRSLPLATLDRRLAVAAKAEGVELI